MKRTDRMFAIVVDLQARRIQRAEDLAARYETSVRTIYRDITALCEAGIPVVSLPGQGYALPPDYFLPPLSLGVDEAAALLLGADYAGQTLDPAFRTAAGAAIAKIEAIVPAALHAPLTEARRAMRLVANEPDARQLDLLRVFRAAIGDRRRVRFYYRGRRTDDPAGRGDVPRSIAPYALTHMHGHWYVVGHSPEREAVRRFRLSRIDDPAVTDERFELPAGFELGPPDPGTDLPVLVRLAFDASDLAAVEERLSGFGATLQADAACCIATFRTHSDSAAVSFVLSWGGAARVLEPPTLRERVSAAARRILQNDPDTLLSGASG